MTNIKSLQLVTFINVLVATIFSTIGLVNPDFIQAGASQNVFAWYAASRTFCTIGLVLYCIIFKKNDQLAILGVLAGMIQVFDGFIGLYNHDLLKSFGPFFLAILQFLVLKKIL